ncbi:MAG: hypothetical protein E7570_00660 [Ruminococcaceae bacterium]|nr:hypothetical protein [Oscillospiraceae bacterium]
MAKGKGKEKEKKEKVKLTKAEKKQAKKEKKQRDKYSVKSKLSKTNKALFIVFIILLVATIVIVALSSAKVPVKPTDPNSYVDEPSIEEFTPGTYGGVAFNSVDDVVNYYVECFAYNKTLTADYTENGEAKKYYKLLGDENLEIENLLVEGQKNAMIDKLVPSILPSVFKGSPKGLPPADNRDPQYDTRDDGPNGTQISQLESHLTADDVLACNVVDNKDGTISITIQPKMSILSMPDQDPQGRFFNVLGDISGTVEKISVLSFSQGTIDENFVVRYAGGSGTITVNTKTKEITTADFEMDVHIDVQHANVSVIKDKSASLDIIYTNHFPASDEFLKNSRNIERK